MLFCLLLAGIIPVSCRYFQAREEINKDNALARVYNEYLYPDELQGLGLSNLSNDDSMKLANELINQWVNQKLLLHYAKDNLGRQVENLEKQIEDYRQSLIIYSYQSHYLDDNLDTTVSTGLAAQWYHEHIDNFVLDHNIYRIRYLTLQKGSPSNDSLKIWLKSSNPDYADRLQLFTLRHAINSNINDSLWFDDAAIRAEFPDRLREQIENRTSLFIEFEDSTLQYNTYILETKIKGEIAPLSYVRDKVIKSILNTRKLDMLDKLTDRIMRDAALNDNYKIYTKEK